MAYAFFGGLTLFVVCYLLAVVLIWREQSAIMRRQNAILADQAALLARMNAR